MNMRVIGALISKDLSLFFRNRFFALMTLLGLIFYLAIYFVMPRAVDESLQIGLYAPVAPPVFQRVPQDGLTMEMADSEEALRDAVIAGRYVAGVALPADWPGASPSGQKATITVYFASDVPQETRDAIEVAIRELAYLQAGQPLALDVSEEVLGPDMLGMQIPPRDRLRPLFAIALIVTETFFLATLITEEVERRTLQALLVTPARVRDILAAKGVLGVGLAFGQAALFMAVVGGMSREALVILVALLLGAVLVTGIGFLIASLARDMMSVMAWGVVVLIPLMVPLASAVFPGMATGWVKAIPSYHLVDAVHRAANFGSGWGDVWQSLAVLLVFNVVIVWVGATALRRRFQ